MFENRILIAMPTRGRGVRCFDIQIKGVEDDSEAKFAQRIHV